MHLKSMAEAGTTVRWIQLKYVVQYQQALMLLSLLKVMTPTATANWILWTVLTTTATVNWSQQSWKHFVIRMVS